MLEAELPTPATVDLDWWDHPLVPASQMEAGLDHNQYVIVSFSIFLLESHSSGYLGMARCFNVHRKFSVSNLISLLRNIFV